VHKTKIYKYIHIHVDQRIITKQMPINQNPNQVTGIWLMVLYLLFFIDLLLKHGVLHTAVYFTCFSSFISVEDVLFLVWLLLLTIILYNSSTLFCVVVHFIYSFEYFFWDGSHYVVQAGVELLASNDSLAAATWDAGTTGLHCFFWFLVLGVVWW
jgi:hypothetical protein